MKFIHLADVHLGAVPDKGCPWSSRRAQEIWDTFRRIIVHIRENPVDLLFISGDLFHSQPLLSELREVNYLFSTIPDTRVFITAGNHDYIRKDSLYLTFQWAENVYFFKEERVQRVFVEELSLYVYGFSYHHISIREPILSGLKSGEGGGLHILMAHGGDENHVPLNVNALCNAGFDYVALGHIHAPGVFASGAARYPGAPEPIDRNDVGEHGFVEGYLEDGRLRTRFVPFACRQYFHLAAELGPEMTREELEDLLVRMIEEHGQENIYTLILQGERSPKLVLFPERMKNLGNIIEIRDESRPGYDIPHLRKQYAGTLLGDYIEYFRGGGDCTETERKALYYGLQALLETGRTEG